MSRWTGLGVATAALAAAVLAAGPVGVRAAEEAPGKSVEKKRRVEVLRNMGGGGHLGVTLEDGQEPGAVVKDVQPDTPAAKAGLQAGDVIVRYQGQRVEGAAALARMVRETPGGRRVEMDVSRGGSVQKLSATLDKGDGMHRWAEGVRDRALGDLDIELPEMPEVPDMPDMSALPAIPPIPPLPRDGGDVNMFRRLLRESGGARKLGIEYQEISGQLARYFKLGDQRGVLVSEVDDDGPAGKAGLRAGDVILKFNGNAVTDSRSFREQVRKADAGSEATLTVSRDGRTLDLTVKLGGNAPARRPERTT
jgi:S1-C subfamily serine protease